MRKKFAKLYSQSINKVYSQIVNYGSVAACQVFVVNRSSNQQLLISNY